MLIYASNGHCGAAFRNIFDTVSVCNLQRSHGKTANFMKGKIHNKQRFVRRPQFQSEMYKVQMEIARTRTEPPYSQNPNKTRTY